MKPILKSIFIWLCLAPLQNVLAQSPVISYTPSAITVTGTIPFTISPKNTGGAVPAVVYGQVTTFAGSPTGMPGFVDGVGTAALFNNSQDMALDAANNLYVADASNNAIRKISPAGVVTTFAGSHTGVAGFADGQDTSARFNYPDGLAFDSLGNLFVSDYYNSAIRKITPGGLVTTFYQNTAELFDPQALTFDSAGNLIFALQYGYQVVKLSPSAVLTTIAGVNRVPGSNDGVGTAAHFNAPTDARLDAAGNLIIADSQNDELRKIAPDGTVTTIAGLANSPVLYANGPALAARFNYLTGVEFGPGGVLYIVDLLNNDIRLMMPDGTVSLLAGSPSQIPGNADSILTAAKFDQPCYMRIDKTGTGYIAEWGLGGASRIRKIALAGYTLKGTLPQGLTFDSTTGTISGTVSNTFTTQTDTVTAFNTSGFSSTIITFTYQQVSNVATLINLVPSVGSLNPAFVSTTNSYVDSVSNATQTITLTPTATAINSTITVNGQPVISGTPSGQIPLAVGSNIITTVITAQDGVTIDTYTVNVIRAPSSNANLIGLTVSQGTLSPAFNSGMMAYADTVSNSTTSITATPTDSDSTATITVNGMPTASGTASNAIPLAVGSNTITVVITAQDGVTTHTYTVIVYRGEAPAEMTTNNVLTPNGDGKNDTWVIQDIALYPQNNVTVFDKGGRVVFYKRGYNNDWDGTLNGKPLAGGTYYYVVDLGLNQGTFKGFISIVRN
jgi:gliding motility-associated-like protein